MGNRYMGAPSNQGAYYKPQNNGALLIRTPKKWTPKFIETAKKLQPFGQVQSDSVPLGHEVFPETWPERKWRFCSEDTGT